MKVERRSFLMSMGAVALGGCTYESLPEDAESSEQALAMPPRPPGNWYKKFWRNGKSPTHGRQWNVGVMSFGASSLSSYTNYMGGAPEFVGANCTGYGSGRWTANSWEKVIGGDYARGDRFVDGPSQPALDDHPQLRAWLGGPRDVWGGLYITTIPFGAPLSECRAAARGERDDRYKRMGARIAWKLSSLGRRIEDVILRPNWEGMNQDTALRIANPSGGKDQFYAAGGTTELYNDMMDKFARAFWDGAGHRVPIAFSPAMQNAGGAPFVPYERYLEPGIYDICCGSFHPNGQRTRTEALARQLVYGREGFHTPADVIRAARRTGAVAAFLEHSASHWASAIQPSIEHYDVAYKAFGDILHANNDVVAFTAVLGARMVNEGGLAGQAGAADGWRRLVRAHRAGFGRVG